MRRWALLGVGVPDGCERESRRWADSRKGHSNRAGPLPAATASVAVGGQGQQQFAGADECDSGCRGKGGGVCRVGGCGASLSGRPAAASPLLASAASAAAISGGGHPERLASRIDGFLSGRQPRPPSRRFAPRTLPQRGGRVVATAISSAVG